MDTVFDVKNLPLWNDPALKAGTKIRTALWLLSEVGIGNVFTKEQHRHAFPGVAQADRRLRDLRASGWVIHTNLEDALLNSSEQRFVTPGSAVWSPSARESSTSASLSAKQRRAIFAEAGYQCSVCGIAGGERYPDSPWMSATLSISKRTPRNADADAEVHHVAECKRCQSGGGGLYDDVPGLIAEISKLQGRNREAIECLIGQPAGGELLKAWAKFRHLSPAGAGEVRTLLASVVRGK